MKGQADTVFNEPTVSGGEAGAEQKKCPNDNVKTYRKVHAHEELVRETEKKNTDILS